MQRVNAARETMTNVDLREQNQPLLIFGGPYGNLEAVEALFGEADRLAGC